MAVKSGKPATICKLCDRKRVKAYAEKNREKTRARNRSRRFTQHGITEAEYEARLAEQGGGCLLCGDTHRLHIDHDHSHCPGQYGCAECFRSILCSRCNTGLGMFRDDPELLRKAALYTESYKTSYDTSC